MPKVHKNIYIDLNGRCGDQFFQYAFARKIQIKIGNQNPLQLNFFNQQRWQKKICDLSFRNDLCHFNIVENNAYINERQNIDRFGSRKQKRLLKQYLFIRRIANKTRTFFIARIFHRRIQKNGIFYEDEYFSLYKYPKKNINIFLKGYFEDYHFYEDELLKSALLKELSPIFCNISKHQLYKRIVSSESVCVSMRSWSEISGFHDVIESRYICDKKYFMAALNEMKKLYPNCTFFIFSDNAEFARQNIGSLDSLVFENEGNSIEDKIILMSSCKHFIISNSSFSWWVQYLSRNDDKTVISPNRWYNDRVDNRLIMEKWIKI